LSSKTTISAEHKLIGKNVLIEDGVSISGISGEPCKRLVIGDNSYIGKNVSIRAPEVYIGDYTVIHLRTTIYGYKPVFLGHCCWVGQEVIINCTAPVYIDNAVTIGAKTTLWTHLKGGDILEGFVLERENPVIIGSDAWIAPGCIISPCLISPKVCLLSGSVVTSNLESNRIYAGIPATDITHKFSTKPFQPLRLEEKFALLAQRLVAFDKSFKEHRGAFSAFSTIPDWRSIILGITEPESTLLPKNVSREEFMASSILITTRKCYERPDASVFSVLDRKYTKKLSDIEIAFMMFILPSIKFFPARDERMKKAKEKMISMLSEYGIEPRLLHQNVADQADT